MKPLIARAILPLALLVVASTGDPASPLASARAATATGALHRCIGSDGGAIFTDRRCDDVQAAEQLPAPASAVTRPSSVLRVRSCARNQDDLLFGVRAALENHDVNRVADYYHWTGLGNAEGYRIMDLLGAFSERPLVDVQLVTAASRRTPPSYAGYEDRVGNGEDDDYRVTNGDYTEPTLLPSGMLDTNGNGIGDAFPDGQAALDPLADPMAETPSSPPRAAELLRVDQMRSVKDAGARVTYFHLRSNAGCWWMQF